MNMLNIMLHEHNFYQRYGLSLLITDKCAEENLGSINFLLPSDEADNNEADIIFRNDMVTINMVNKMKNCRGADSEKKKTERITMHFPFLTRNQSFHDISIKIGKLLTIARSDYNLLANRDEIYWELGLKKYTQLSDTENDVMILIGRGYTSTDISRILNRSPKTISTHCRNARRKMGAENRTEFYRYASFIANCGGDERNTLCL